MTSSPQLRKRIYVDRHVQGGIVARLAALWIATMALAIGLGLLTQFFANPTEGLAPFLDDAWRNIVPLLLAFAVTLPIAVLHLLRFSHRFAGPIVRLRRGMQALANGLEAAPMQFREHDYWQDLAEEFNRIRSRLEKATQRVAELEAQVAESTPSKQHAAEIATAGATR